MLLVICPGIHAPSLSDRFVAALQRQLSNSKAAAEELPQPYAILPTQRYAPFNGLAVWSFLQKAAESQIPLLIIGFSAGVVGAIAAAQLWQKQGWEVVALIAVDGWGVPQIGSFPLYRVSHDHFTHWSSALLGTGLESFYAEPPIDHLDLWQFPERAMGYQVSTTAQSASQRVSTTAVEFIAQKVLEYGVGTRLEPLQ